MNESTQRVLRSLLPAWVFCLLLPLPAVLFWHSHDGRFIALCCFFVGSTSVVVWSFRDAAAHANAALAATDLRHPEVVWRERMLMVALALVAAWMVFPTGCLVLNDPHDLIAPVLALSSLIPSLCIAPYLTLAMRKPFAAVVLTLFSLGCMKLVAGIVTCLVYGWHASEHGHTAMTWTQPNLIVWAFVVAAAILSASFYTLGATRFRSIYACAAEPRCTEWRPRHAAWRYGRHGGAAIGEPIVSAMTLSMTAVLVLTVAVVGAGCEKRDPIVAEYSSVGSGRPDGGWTVRLYASGKCEVNGPIKGAGTYSSNSVGYQLQTVIPARSLPMLIHRVVHGIERGTTMLISVKTNGTEYLLEPTKYRSFQRTSDTNMLREELKKVR